MTYQKSIRMEVAKRLVESERPSFCSDIRYN